MRPTGWTVAYAVAVTIESFGQARPLWIAVGAVAALLSLRPRSSDHV